MFQRSYMKYVTKATFPCEKMAFSYFLSTSPVAAPCSLISTFSFFSLILVLKNRQTGLNLLSNFSLVLFGTRYLLYLIFMRCQGKMCRNFQDLQKKMHGTLQFFLFDVTINCNLLLIKIFFGKYSKRYASITYLFFHLPPPLSLSGKGHMQSRFHPKIRS